MQGPLRAAGGATQSGEQPEGTLRRERRCGRVVVPEGGEDGDGCDEQQGEEEAAIGTLRNILKNVKMRRKQMR